MGWMDKARAASQVAMNNVQVVAKDLIEETEEYYQDNSNFQALKQTAGRGVEKAKVAAQEGKDFGSAATQEIGETDSGAAVGRMTRRGTQSLGQLPGFSMATESAAARHGVPELLDLFKDDPESSERMVWLAEALASTRRDLNLYHRTRSVISPTYAIVRSSLKVGGSLGAEPSDLLDRRLRKKAFVVSTNLLHENPRDSRSLHALARIYLAEKDYAQAIRFSKLSIVANRDDGLAWITLSRAFRAASRHDSAIRAADRATELGAGYGHQAFADAFLKQARASDDILTAEERLSLVTPEDREAYLGVAVNAKGLVTEIKDGQVKKTRALKSRLTSLLEETDEQEEKK